MSKGAIIAAVLLGWVLVSIALGPFIGKCIAYGNPPNSPERNNEQ